jgi:DNA-binding NarL/FixJ family response regulator
MSTSIYSSYMKANGSIPHFKRKIIIIEDNETICQGYTLLINSTHRFEVEATYRNCEAALKNLKNIKPDIVLMDLDLQGMNGIEGIRSIKARYAHIEILIVSVYDSSQFVYDSLCAGASGYLTKSSNYLELIAALDQLVAGGAPMSSKIARMVVESFQRNPLSPLSKRETEVLSLLSRGYSYSSIAKLLFIAKETVKTHLKNIYQKLQVNSKADAIILALEERYI